MKTENVNGRLVLIPDIEDLKVSHKELEEKIERKKKEMSDVKEEFERYKEKIQ